MQLREKYPSTLPANSDIYLVLLEKCPRTDQEGKFLDLVDGWTGIDTDHRLNAAILHSHSGMAQITTVKGNPPRAKLQAVHLVINSVPRCSHFTIRPIRMHTAKEGWNIQTGRITCPRNARIFPQPPSAGEMNHKQR